MIREQTARSRGRPALQDIEGRLLDAIETLLNEGQTFGTVSVSALARRAGIGRATFYLHFKDKGELVARLLARISEEVVSSGGAWFANAKGAGPREVHAALTGVARTFQRHRAILAAVADTVPFDENVAARHAAMMDQLCAASRGAVATVCGEGRAEPGVGPATADMLTWMVALYCTRFFRQHGHEPVSDLVDTLTTICVGAIFRAPDQTAP